MLVSSADGTRALFGTDEALTSDDDRPGGDYYERVGNTTRLLAHDTGTDDPRIATGFYFASADATRIVIAGGGHWTAGDTDDMFSDDVYTAKDGVVEWVSRGPMGGNADSFSARLARRGRGLGLRLTATRALLVGLERVVSGRRDGATCRKPSRRLRHARRCSRTVTAARTLRLPTTGRRAMLRIGGRSLRPGLHRVTITPLAADGRPGAPLRLTLKLKR